MTLTKKADSMYKHISKIVYPHHLLIQVRLFCIIQSEGILHLFTFISQYTVNAVLSFFLPTFIFFIAVVLVVFLAEPRAQNTANRTYWGKNKNNEQTWWKQYKSCIDNIANKIYLVNLIVGYSITIHFIILFINVKIKNIMALKIWDECDVDMIKKVCLPDEASPEGTVLLSHTPSFKSLSRISQLNIPGFSRLYSSIRFSTSGVATCFWC